MIFAASSFLDLAPTFVSGVYTLHNTLIGVTFVFAFLGLLLMANRAAQEQSVQSILPTVVRLGVVVILIGSLGGLVNTVNDGVQDIASQMGLGTMDGSILKAYREAVARKFGTDSAGTPAQVPNQNSGNTGSQLTHYGYEKPGDPDYDSKSAQGIGAFGFDDQPNSLIPLQSAALSSDMVQKYNVQPGQEFTVNTANGPINLVYADKTADWVQGRIDIYDPNQSLDNNYLSQSVNSITTGGNTQAGGGGIFGGWISKIGDSLTVGIVWSLAHLLSMLAIGIMWIMSGAQQVLTLVEIAISPIFLGFFMIPALRGNAQRFFLSLAALCLWPLAWAVCDLFTKALIDLTINPTNNLIQSGFAATSMAYGMWVVLAAWVILSSFCAPMIISKLIMGVGSSGTSGTTAVFGATIGALAMKSAQGGAGIASMATGAAGAPMVAGVGAVRTAYKNFATRGIKPVAK